MADQAKGRPRASNRKRWPLAESCAHEVGALILQLATAAAVFAAICDRGIDMQVLDGKLAALAAEANDAHDEAQDCFHSGIEHAMRAGKALLRAKSRLGHGSWLPWLGANFRGSDRTAQLYMRLARHVPKLDEETRIAVADLTLREADRAIATPLRIVQHKTEIVNHPISIRDVGPEPFTPSVFPPTALMAAPTRPGPSDRAVPGASATDGAWRSAALTSEPAHPVRYPGGLAGGRLGLLIDMSKTSTPEAVAAEFEPDSGLVELGRWFQAFGEALARRAHTL